MSRITPSLAVTHVRIDGESVSCDRRADRVAGEEPLELRVGGTTITTTMRTPGHDVELAHGFLLSEGIIATRDDVAEARYCAGATGPQGTNTYNVLDVTLAPHTRAPGPEFIRTTATTSACGVCGSTSIDHVMSRAAGRVTPLPLDPHLVARLPDMLREHQQGFRRTGGLHAAGAFSTAGDALVVREDIGRHNAADKVIGALLAADAVPAHNRILVMSSRASFELVQKAAMAGFGALVAVSAASSLAVDLARELGLTLIGFARGDRFNLYSGELTD
ncbi:formate dehydrogenase accessory sulfurtransferase FdhD [Corynebacterium uberis]|uniref:formate dehydrogenase accessory sulfurtransferase FdhD n=1 Tax=Corynebacterium TaxID=1716 RepID=UPI001D0B62CE|nr:MULTISPECIES: formate dehydrogenase accessory sulfurtransferase FdhD [Corynebacterium]MCZ9309391.1 formate dehydrogenase accessory sulfurtransferase FdhD [Corynebacterium sp. c6VSa_13]UDL72940.1 formate dehydrogenase accessory sulfurtransferase FdhD [Corynebacterium uberis]UDL76183.1 formate dehydrogenase accessory sulfurtransferase FdhD [Corynebacterium uberis]UDL78395.1 formate dehydrogenase accessory sulfurtransferase FdhD [Corynebacterium uberis]UDL80678.1 formate dehydrogenase accessor